MKLGPVYSRPRLFIGNLAALHFPLCFRIRIMMRTDLWERGCRLTATPKYNVKYGSEIYSLHRHSFIFLAEFYSLLCRDLYRYCY